MQSLVKSIHNVKVENFGSVRTGGYSLFDGLEAKNFIFCGYDGDEPGLHHWKRKLLPHDFGSTYGMKACKSTLWEAHLFFKKHGRLNYKQRKSLGLQKNTLLSRYYCLLLRIDRYMKKGINPQVIFLSKYDEELAQLIGKYLHWLNNQ